MLLLLITDFSPGTDALTLPDKYRSLVSTILVINEKGKKVDLRDFEDLCRLLD